jgi:hypothetical protein
LCLKREQKPDDSEMKRLDSVFEGLDERETAYVLARSDAVSNSEALKKCGMSEGWLYKRNYEDLNARADILRKDKALRAALILGEAVEQAAKVKVAGLKVRDERIKQAVATEILDREFGKPTQRQEVTGKDGGVIVINMTGDIDD